MRSKQVIRNMAAVLVLAGLAGPVGAVTVEFDTAGASDGVRAAIRGASLIGQIDPEDGAKDGQDVLAAARADYARILAALYDQGYYSGRISIRLDGREAAEIPPLDAPATVGRVVIRVEPGPAFRFSRAGIGPLARATELPEDYRRGSVARSGAIVDAAGAGLAAWRAVGHAKAGVAGQKIVADHRDNAIASDIRIAPGPVVTFGALSIKGNQRLRTSALRRIASFPTGERYSPDDLDRVRARLQRTGIFSSAALIEADRLSPGDRLDYTLSVAEQKPRRIGFGAEIASLDGIGLSGYWLHRNLFHGGERFRIEGGISGIGGATGGTDYSLGMRLDRPATFNPDTSAFIETNLFRTEEEDYTERGFDFGLGFTRIFSEQLSAEVGLRYGWSQVDDSLGRTVFRQIAFPASVTWDRRLLHQCDSDPVQGVFGDRLGGAGHRRSARLSAAGQDRPLRAGGAGSGRAGVRLGSGGDAARIPVLFRRRRHGARPALSVAWCHGSERWHAAHGRDKVSGCLGRGARGYHRQDRSGGLL